MKLRYWILACAASAAAAFAGCSYGDGRQDFAETRSDVGFFLVEEGGSAKLAYGLADSDDVGLMMECGKGSRRIEVSDLVRSSPAPRLILASSGDRSEFDAHVQPGPGQDIVTVSAPSRAPALDGFRRSGKIEVAYAGLRYDLEARSSEKPLIERFFAACEGRS